mgnify:FL=1
MQRRQQEELIAAFHAFDVEGKGFITAEELRQAMINFGEPLSEEELQHLLNMADVDRDGRINFVEFVRWQLAPTS